MARQYDVIVVGGGHNGLVHAAYLARAGLDVCVLEARPLVGGATVTEEIFPGFRYSVFSYVVSLMRPEIIRELELPRHGLTILPLESTLTPLPDGDRLYRDADHDRSWREIARFSVRDAEAYDDYGRSLFFMARAVKYLLDIVPPDPGRLAPGDITGLLRLGRHFLGLEPDQLHLLMKLMTMSAADFLEEWFETDVLKATLSASGIIGTFLGPRSPGTAYVLLHHYMGEIDGHFRAWGFAKGGTGAVAEAIASAAREAGAEIRTDAPVARVLVRNGRVTGVALANGDEVHGRVVSSSLDPRRTFLDLVDPHELPEELVQSVRAFRFRGSSGKVNLALDAAPDFTCMPGFGPHLRGAVSISPSIDYLERAYDDAKYGDYSKEPYIDIIIPSAIDPGMAPPGKHVMSCFVQYAPYELREGNWDDKREAFGDVVIDTLARYVPNLRDIILHRQVLTPLDIERTTGLSQGNIFQGELSPSQLFFLRPAAGYAKYRTPVQGYYQCGSGTHPGGGIMGAPGKLAATTVLADMRRGRRGEGTVTKYDAVVVGAGHNALVAAALLAREGWRVLVLERREALGGAAATEEIFPGCRANVAAQDAGLFRREIVSDLGLDAHGLEWVHPPAVATSLTGGGGALTLWRNPGRAREELAHVSRADADRFPDWADYVRTMARVLRVALGHPAPVLHDASRGERLRSLGPLLQAGRLGRRNVVELLRVLPLPARDLLDDWFTSDVLKGMLGSSALLGTTHGPSAMGGAFRMLYHATGSEAYGFRSSVFVKGGIGVLSEALASAARANGAEVRTGAEVERVLIEDGAATGVVLAGGEEIAAGCVVSGADPRRTFFGLVGAPRLGPEFNRKVGNIRLRGTTATLHLLLDALPPLPDARERLAGHTLVAPSLDYLERASDAAKYGRCSARPHLDMVVPTLHNPGLAPDGRHLASIQIRYAPRRLRSGDWRDDASREALLASVFEVLDEFLPGLGERVLDQRLLTPLDLETEFGLSGGDEYHGQMGLDQLLFMRPVPGWGRYRTPVERLFLCSAGTHPGGGVTGAPGRLAAREILRDRGLSARLGARG